MALSRLEQRDMLRTQRRETGYVSTSRILSGTASSVSGALAATEQDHRLAVVEFRDMVAGLHGKPFEIASIDQLNMVRSVIHMDPDLLTLIQERLLKLVIKNIPVGVAFWEGLKDLLTLVPSDMRVFNWLSFQDISMSGMDFSDVDFSHVDLAKVEMQFMRLKGANFTFANLNGVDLIGSSFDGAILKDTSLSGTKIKSIHGISQSQMLELSRRGAIIH